MISIFKKNSDYEFEQRFIDEAEPIPDGWTTDYDSLEIIIEPDEIEVLRQENLELAKRFETTEHAVLELADLIFSSQSDLEGG